MLRPLYHSFSRCNETFYHSFSVGIIRYTCASSSLKYHYLKSSRDVTCTLLSQLPLFAYLFCTAIPTSPSIFLYLYIIVLKVLHCNMLNLLVHAQYRCVTPYNKAQNTTTRRVFCMHFNLVHHIVFQKCKDSRY